MPAAGIFAVLNEGRKGERPAYETLVIVAPGKLPRCSTSSKVSKGCIFSVQRFLGARFAQAPGVGARAQPPSDTDSSDAGSSDVLDSDDGSADGDAPTGAQGGPRMPQMPWSSAQRQPYVRCAQFA